MDDDPLVGHFGGDATTPPPAPAAAPEDDPLVGHFGTGEQGGYTPYTPAPTWHAADIPKGLEIGWHTGVGAPLAEVTGQREEAEAERATAAQTRETMTPGAEQTWPVYIAEQAAPTAVTLAPSAVPGVGPALSAGVGAVIQGGGAISQNQEAINNANDADLAQNNPVYRSYRQSGMTEQQAKAQLGQDMALTVGLPSAIIGGLTAGVGGVELGGAAARLGVGEAETAALTGNVLTRRVSGRGAQTIVGAGRGLAEQTPLGAAQTYVSGQAEAQEGVGEEPTPSEILAGGVGQGLFGAAVGAFGGFMHGAAKKGPEAQTPVVTQRVDNTQTAGEATTKRTPRVGYKKTEPPPAAAAPAPSPKVDADQSAALGQPPAPPVTPRVSEPQVGPVEQPPVVQPEPPVAEPARAAQEAPTQPAGTETPAEPETRPTAESVQPEPQETLAEQHAALLDPNNPREATLYPPGSQVFDIPDKSSFGQVKLPDGRIVQYAKDGPSAFTAAKIRQYVKDDRLNEALGLGPVSKDEAVARAASGEPQAVVTERTPQGTEVKAAAGTEATAPAQAAALEAVKTPGNVVGVERPEEVLGDRIERVRAEMAARQAELDAAERGGGYQPPGVAREETVQPPVVQPAYPAGKPAGRILEAQDEAAVQARRQAAFEEAQQIRRVQDELKAKQAAKEAAAREAAGVKERSHAGKAQLAKIAGDNVAAKRIVAEHPAPPVTDNVKRPTQIYDRAKAMVQAAKSAGIDIPKAFPEGHPHSGAMLKLREAADLTASKTPKWDAYARFLDREHLIDNGREQEAFEARRNEGALGLGSPEGGAEVKPKGGAVDEEGRGEERAGVTHEETPVEHMAGGGEEEREEKVPDALAAAREEQARKLEARRAESEAMRREAAPPSAPKAAVGFQQVVKKSRAIRLRDIEGGEEKPKQVTDHNSAGDEVTFTPVRTTTARQAISETFDITKYPAKWRPMVRALMQHIVRLAGDTPVHYVTAEDMARLETAYTRGFYSGGDYDHIILHQDLTRQDTPFHEAFHAATSKGINAQPELQHLIDRLMDEVKNQMGEKETLRQLTVPSAFSAVKYSLSSRAEFLTGIMTKPEVLEALKHMTINDALARDIGIPKWRRATVFNGIVQTILRAFGLGPQAHSVVEAALALSEYSTWTRHPGEAMEYGGRFARADIEERLHERMRDIVDPEQAIHTRGEDMQEAADKPPGFWDRELAQATTTGAYQKAFDAFTKGANTDTLRIGNEHLFGDKTEANSFRRVQEGLLNQGAMIQRMLKEHDPLMQRVMDMKRTNPDGLNRLVTLLSEASDFNVHPDEALGSGLNDYIKPNSKTGEYDHTTNDRYHEAILAHSRLSDEFNRSTPEEQALFRDLRDTLMEEGHKSVQAGIETFSNGLRENFANDKKLQDALKTPEANRTPSEIKQVERYNAVSKVLDGDKLDGDEKDKFKDDPHIKMLRDLRSMLTQEGPHFPGQRKGDWVVNGDHELPEAPNALSVKDNEVTFGSEKEAYDYRQKLIDQSLPSRMEKVTEPTSTAQKPGQPDQYKVTVQLKHSSAVGSVFEGKKLANALRQMGLKNVTEPMLREKNVGIDYGLHSGTLRAMDHAIDALTHLGNDEKAALKEANQQAALGLMKGNRINSGLLKSNRVRGANADPVLAIHDYLANSARSRARSKTMPDIDKAFGEMRDTARNVQDKDTWKRGMLVREMEDRALHFGKDGFTNQMSPNLQRVTTLAYLKDMMAPIHYLLDLTHPYLYSIPQIAGRHGFGASHGAYLKALNDMGAGGTLGRGVKGVVKALTKGAAHAPTDLISGIRDSLAKSGATADELKAFDSAKDTHLSSIITDYRKAFDRTNAFDRSAQYLQDIGNEMSHAVDTVNRTAAYMTAYRLERAKMGKASTLAEQIAHHAQAVRYAKDTVSQTQGLYSAANRSTFMKNPYVRGAMQFRSIPMMIYRVLAKNIYNAVKGETLEIKRGAIISLVSTMGTTAALAGAAAGVPEPIRLAVELSHALGLPVGSWQDYEDKMRRVTTNSLGKFGGHMVMDGILGAAGLSAGSRIGLSDLLVKDQALASPKDFLLEMVGGAGVGYIKDEWDGINNILKGNYAKGIPGVMPIRLFSDVAKAYAENQEGKQGVKGQPDMTPLDPYETFIKAMGGTPTREALYGKETSLMKEEGADRKQAIAAAAGGDRTAQSRWNLAHPNNRITQSHILKARQSGRNAPPTPRQRAVAEQYNVYQ